MEPSPAAREAHERASACIDDRRFAEAIPHAEEAARLAPAWGEVWWNLGVGYKHARRWREALDACDRVIALDGAGAQGVHWNAGIAASALGDWTRARTAWRAAGIDVGDGSGPIEMDLGPVALRVAPESAPEVVWSDRLDPCRARIRSVPTPASGHRFGDLVLHDGEPRGRRQLGERSVPVFDELLLLERSAYGTWEILVRVDAPAHLAEVTGLLDADAVHVEDWTGSLEMLCAQCSLGEPHEHERGERPSATWNRERRLGIAARDAADLAPLRRWGWRWRREVQSVRRVL